MPEELFFRGSHVGSLVKVLRELLETLDKDLGGLVSDGFPRHLFQFLLGLTQCSH